MKNILLTAEEENYLKEISEYLTSFNWQPEKCEAELNDSVFWKYIDFFREKGIDKETYGLQILFQKRCLPEKYALDIPKRIKDLNKKHFGLD